MNPKFIYKSDRPYGEDLNDLVSDLEEIAKGKALPIGTRRTWSGQDYVKTGAGWVPVSTGKHGTKPEEVPASTKASSESNGPSSPKETQESKASKVEKLQELKEAYEEDGKKHAAKIVDAKIKGLDPAASLPDEAKKKAKKKALKSVTDISHFKEDMINSEIKDVQTQLDGNQSPENHEFFKQKLGYLNQLKDHKSVGGQASQFKQFIEESEGGLSSSEKGALGIYQGDSGGSDISWTQVQDVARGKKAKSPEAQSLAEQTIKNMSSAIQKSPLEKDTTVYRGGSFSKELMDQLKPGFVMSNPGFTSTSKSKSVAQGYADSSSSTDNGQPVIFHLDLPKGTKAFDFANKESAYSDLNEEKEVLLDRNVKFKVESVSTSGGHTVIKIKLDDGSKSVKEDKPKSSSAEPIKGEGSPWLQDESIKSLINSKDWGKIKKEHLSEPQDVDISSLTATEQGQNAKQIEEIASSKKDTDPIYVVKYKGKMYIGDGHHRANAAKLSGKESIKAKIMDMDAASGKSVTKGDGINRLIGKLT